MGEFSDVGLLLIFPMQILIRKIFYNVFYEVFYKASTRYSKWYSIGYMTDTEVQSAMKMNMVKWKISSLCCLPLENLSGR